MSLEKKALDFARKQGYDSLTVMGCYENYEVYSPYCKSWKEDPPVIGLPQLILANEKVRLGKYKFEGANMFAEDMAEAVPYYQTHKLDENESFIFSLFEFQKLFAVIKAKIDNFCSGENIWDGFNKE